MSDATSTTEPGSGATNVAPGTNGDPNAEAAKWRRQLRDLEAAIPGQLDQARAEARAEMTQHVLDARIEARAAALGFVDPGDAVQFVADRAGLLDDKGSPDRGKIDDALAAVLEAKSYLAGTKPVGFGSADQGARGRPSAKTSSGDWARDLMARKA